MSSNNTIAAIASPPGSASRGVIRISGLGTAALLASLLESPHPDRRGIFPARLKLGGDLSLPVLVMRFVAPNSYTGEDAAEILMPGNLHLLDRVLTQICAHESARLATPGEFTERAYLAGRLSLSQAEGVAQVIAATNKDELAAARELLAGRTGRAYDDWADRLATLLALVEAGVDFTDQEDVVPILPSDLADRLDRIRDAITAKLGAAGASLSAPHDPVVVLVGQPNAGKSTLFNALLGRPRAIVADAAGTTRDILAEPLDLSGALPGAGSVMLTDLAGLADTAISAIDAEAQTRARDHTARADVLIHCDPDGRFVLPAGVPGETPTIRVRTKSDMFAPAAAGELPTGAIPICALDGWNLAVLRRAIADLAVGKSSANLVPRHRRALADAAEQLGRAAEAIDPEAASLAEPEIVAGALRNALDSLGELTGRITPDDIIGRVFATFCVGK